MDLKMFMVVHDLHPQRNKTLGEILRELSKDYAFELKHFSENYSGRDDRVNGYTEDFE